MPSGGWWARGSLVLAVLILSTPRIEADTAHVDFFPIPTAESSPADIVAAGDGNLWFTQTSADKVGRITTAGVVTEFLLPAGTAPLGIATASNFVFIAGSASGAIVRFTINAGSDANIQASRVSLGPAPAGSIPTGITHNPADGLLYITLAGTDKIARLGTAGGVVLETALPAGSHPTGIVPSGNDVFFTAAMADQIGRITTAGSVNGLFPITGGGKRPRNITRASDGTLWFTEPGSHQIGRFSGGALSGQFLLPPGTTPWDITAGPTAGTLYFTAYGAIGRITTTGTITLFALPGGVEPGGIAAGADGNVWFTDAGTNQIGRLDPDAPAPSEHTATDLANVAVLPDDGCAAELTGVGIGGISRQILVQEGGRITDLDVVLQISHSFRSDIQVGLSYTPLVGPAIAAVRLASGHGGSSDNYFATFDSDAADFCSAAANCGGLACGNSPGPACRPDQSLGAFDGASTPGVFTLNVCDQAAQDIGTLLRWSVVPSGVGVTMDVDGNGVFSALTDGLLAVRYAFGLTGDALISGVVAGNCTRCTAPQIEAYFAEQGE